MRADHQAGSFKRVFAIVRSAIVAAVAMAIYCATPAFAVDRGTISDEFEGCDFGKVYALDDGRVLVCNGYSYSYSYRPEVIVLDQSTVLIDGNEYQARVTTGVVFKTKVDGAFEGCEHDKIIPFENGLAFECREYGYKYAYRADVLISEVDGVVAVSIDGKTYRGTLYRR